jgi:hypothetical protein
MWIFCGVDIISSISDISLIFLQFMTGKNIDEKECFGKKSMKIFDLEKRFRNL